MRIRALVFVALFSIPSLVDAQARPRIGRTPTPLQPAEKPPEIPVVSRSLAMHRSRWSGEAYAIVNANRVPTGDGVSFGSTFGAGSRADYRFGDRFSGTFDLTTTISGGLESGQTAEVGARFLPIRGNPQIRPYVDLRGAYLYMADAFGTPPGVLHGGTSTQFVQRYSRGFGAVAGAGADLFVSNDFAVTVTATGVRSRMTVHRIEDEAVLPVGSRYWMTSFRVAFGFKYNPAKALQFAQNPRM